MSEDTTSAPSTKDLQGAITSDETAITEQTPTYLADPEFELRAEQSWNRVLLVSVALGVLFVSVPFEEVLGEILGKVDNSHMGVILKRMMLRAATSPQPAGF